MKARSVTVRVPASTSNLGSGFDTLGLALKLHNTVRVRRIAGKGVVLTARKNEEQRAGDFAMVRDASKLFFRQTGRRAFGMEVFVDGDVPPARGLGYSATIRVGVLAALNELAGARLNRDELLQLATELEGHTDHVSPAAFSAAPVPALFARPYRSPQRSPKRYMESSRLLKCEFCRLKTGVSRSPDEKNGVAQKGPRRPVPPAVASISS